MERLRVSATKSSLLRLKEELAFAREGKALLTQKREVLVMEMLRLQDDALRAREELDRQLAEAYRAFALAAMLEGFDAIERLALAIPVGPEVKIEERSVMGVVLPIVRGQPRPWQPTYGLASGSVATDQAVRLFHELEKRLREVAEIETAIYRLAMETRKTIRRERALENLFIPQYAATVKFIQESLEEKDRESFYQMKILKGGMTR
jgi:V/A-type H+-transporting ATPase subunit D